MSKRKAIVLSILMAALMVVMFQPVTPSYAAGGSGTQTDPWVLEYGETMDLVSEDYPDAGRWRVPLIGSSANYITVDAGKVKNINTSNQDQTAEVVYGNSIFSPRFYIIAKAQVADTVTVNYVSQGSTLWTDENIPNNQPTTIRSDIPTRDNYNFMGWSTTQRGTASVYPGQTYDVNVLGPKPTITFYAVWGQVSNNFTLNITSLTAKGDAVTYDGNLHEISGYSEDYTANTDGYLEVGTYTTGGRSYAAYAKVNGIKAEGTNAGTYSTPMAAPLYYYRYNTYNQVNGSYIPVTAGTLTISPLEITVETESADKTPDGTALTAGGKISYKVGQDEYGGIFYYGSGDAWTTLGLIGTESIDIRTTGSQTDPGESDNTYEYVLTSNNYKIDATKDKIGKLHVHDWKFDKFVWEGDADNGYTKATAQYKCDVAGCIKTETSDASLTPEVTDPTCETGGKTTYKAEIEATASLDGAAHEESKDAKITQALGHDWEFEWFVWFGDETAGYTEAKAEYKCKRNGCLDEHLKEANLSEAVTDPTCETGGKTTYTAAIDATASMDGIAHAESKDAKPTDPLGHDWLFKGFVWIGDETAGFTGADGKYECQRTGCGADDTIAAKLDEVVTPPKCEEKGLTTYFASIDATDSPDGDVHADKKEGKETPATGHKWDAGKVTKQPTSYVEGVKTFTCTAPGCGATRTEAVAKLAPGADPNQKGSDGTAVGPGASEACADKAITSAASDKELAGSKFAPLKVKSTKPGKTSVKITWAKNKKAVRYVVYGNTCNAKGNKYKSVKVAAVTGDNYTVKQISNKKVKKGTYYKFIIVALDKNNEVVSTSKTIHVATSGGKVGNYKSVTVEAKVGKETKAVSKVSIKKGKSLKLKVKLNPASKDKKVQKHEGVRYETSNAKIATVSGGKIKANAKGTCTVYVYAQNGVNKAIKVTVK